MKLRSSILAGLAAVLCLGAPAFAAMPSAEPSAEAVKSDVVLVAAKSPAAELRQLKRKKKPTDGDLARIKELEAQVKAEQAAARTKALEARKLALREAAKARAQARREAFLSSKDQKTAEEAKPVKAVAKAEPVKEVEQPVSADVATITSTGNNGELRSDTSGSRSSGGLFAGLFGGSSASTISYLPETRALDSVLEKRQARRPFKVKPEFEPQEVNFTGYEPGTIVINTSERRLYLVETPFTARRYAIAVGREGLQFKGATTVGDKQEWPRWIPTLDMQKREPKHYGQYKDGMPGGPDNPLGARAIYLYQGRTDTHLRIHGTNQPQTIGTSASNGCFRMINDQVMDLYRRVKMGTKVVIL